MLSAAIKYGLVILPELTRYGWQIKQRQIGCFSAHTPIVPPAKAENGVVKRQKLG